ncbi:aspartate kinase [Lactobacillaceae bacterium Melli_B3]
MIVAKFGGSSMADSDQFKKVKSIIKQNNQRRVVVVSAAGKGVNNPIKLTDQLIEVYQLARDGRDYATTLNQIWHRIQLIVDTLDLDIQIHDELANIAMRLTKLSYAELVSRGEYLTAQLLSAYLDWPMVDAADFLLIDNGRINFAESRRRLLTLTENVDHCVIPGFYGVNSSGAVALLPRGGGDTSGAAVANLVNARLYENWTDTNGILAVDPRIVSTPDKVDALSYDELQELSYLGVKVFNEEAVQPVRVKNIPIKIMNTNRPSQGGTLVVPNKDEAKCSNNVAGIAGKQDQVILTVKKYQLSSHVDAMVDLIKLVNSFNFKSTYSLSGDAISFVLSGVNDLPRVNQLVAQIRQLVDPDSIQVSDQIAKVAVVSEEFRRHPRVVGKMIELLEQNQIEVQQVIQTSDDIKVVFGISNQDYQKAIRCLYQRFFRAFVNQASLSMSH